MPSFDYYQTVAKISTDAREQALARQMQLTKPPGSLGELEDIAVQFAGFQDLEKPSLDSVAIRVFAGDHGVCAQGVSAFPQQVTQQMVHNFCSGGAAVSVLSKTLSTSFQNWDFQVWNMGTVDPLSSMDGLIDKQIAPGSSDFTRFPAMTEDELLLCLQSGADAVPEGADLFIGGEMGIGNTTSASALMAALFKLDAPSVVGHGTGVDEQGLARKVDAVAKALQLHTSDSPGAIEILRRLGGLEIAALVGAYIRAAQLGIPSLVDGFITSAAAACAVAINPGVRDWLLFGHCSAEQAHSALLDQLSANPILKLGMRLGEGSGAVTAVPMIRLALALHANMATFADAGVSNKSE